MPEQQVQAELVLWLTDLWALDDFESIEVQQAFGRRKNLLGEMIYIRNFVFNSRLHNPNTEQINTIAKHILMAVQNDCDCLGRLAHYQIRIYDSRHRSVPLVRRIVGRPKTIEGETK